MLGFNLVFQDDQCHNRESCCQNVVYKTPLSLFLLDAEFSAPLFCTLLVPGVKNLGTFKVSYLDREASVVGDCRLLQHSAIRGKKM